MLEVRNLQAGYGKSRVLQGVDLDVGEGEIVSLIGRNGAGRSTACKAIMGLLPVTGSVRFRGRELAGRPAHEVARSGLGYVPEDRQIFEGLTTRQNLELGRRHTAGGVRWTLDEAYELFPQLRERAQVRAELLSGGEQQMLAMARTLMGSPALVMVDEPTEGLAPQLVAQTGDFLQRIAAAGVAVLLVEQKLAIALRVSRCVCVMGQGRIVYSGTPGELRENAAVRRTWLEV